MESRYGVKIEMVGADTTVSEYEKLHEGPLYQKAPDQCCFDRKIAPMRKAVEGYDCWITAVRRDQTLQRRKAQFVDWDEKFALVKVAPILKWTKTAI